MEEKTMVDWMSDGIEPSRIVYGNVCFYHEDRHAVASCVRCGKSLCKECATKHFDSESGHSLALCDDCAAIYEEERRSDEKELLAEEWNRYDLAKKEFNKQKAWFFVKLFFTVVLLLFTLIWGEKVFGLEPFWLLPLSFIPFGISVWFNSFDPRNHPKYNPGIITGILIAIVGGIIIFFRDLVRLLKKSSVKEPSSPRPNI